MLQQWLTSSSSSSSSWQARLQQKCRSSILRQTVRRDFGTVRASRTLACRATGANCCDFLPKLLSKSAFQDQFARCSLLAARSPPAVSSRTSVPKAGAVPKISLRLALALECPITCHQVSAKVRATFRSRVSARTPAAEFASVKTMAKTCISFLFPSSSTIHLNSRFASRRQRRSPKPIGLRISTRNACRSLFQFSTTRPTAS
jgi:hypothetical protein